MTPDEEGWGHRDSLPPSALDVAKAVAARGVEELDHLTVARGQLAATIAVAEGIDRLVFQVERLAKHAERPM